MISLKTLALLLVAVLAAAISGCGGSSEPPTTPALVFENQNIDFGLSSGSRQVPLAYTVKNVSDRTVRIVTISTGCVCTRGADNPEVINPGEEAVINILFRPGFRHGRYEQTLTVKTDDAAQVDYDLMFNGLLYSPVRWEPRVLDLGELPAGREHVREVALLAMDGRQLDLTEALAIQDSRVRMVRDRVEEFAEPDAGGTLHKGVRHVYKVTVPATLPVGLFSTKMIVDSDLTESEEQTQTVALTDAEAGEEDGQGMLVEWMPALSIHGEIVADVDFQPKRVFGRLKPGERRSELLSLTSRSQTPFVVKEINDDGVVTADYSIQEGETPYEKKLVVTFDAGSGSGGSTGKVNLVVQSDGEDHSVVIQIPVIMIVHESN